MACAPIAPPRAGPALLPPPPAAMTCDRDPSHPPPEKRPAKPMPSTTTIDSLGDDLILAIFLYLPSFTAIVRAAFACRAWRRAVASSPSFRRRFLALHPAPLLGLFFSPSYCDSFCTVPIFPTFVPSRCPDRELAGVIRTGDFFLTFIQVPAPNDKVADWDIVACRGGFVLLGDWSAHGNLYALFNPSTRQFHGSFDIPWDILARHGDYCPILHDTQLICSDEDPMSFRVICLAHDDSSMVRAAVFSSDTREWSVLPWVEISPRPHCDGDCDNVSEVDDESKCESVCLENGTQDSGSFIYWPFKNRKNFIMLDTTTMMFSVAQLPSCLRNQNSISSFVMGETKDASPCVVYTDEFNIGVVLRNADDGTWVLGKLHSLNQQVRQVLGCIGDHVSGLNVVAIRNGYVYMKTVLTNLNPVNTYWFLYVCLKTMELEKVFQSTRENEMQPYIMPWPPCLVGDYGRFAGEAAPSKAKNPDAAEN